MPHRSVLDRHLVIFNFLPSTTLHATRYDDYGSGLFARSIASMPGLANTWHRHWSRRILQQENLLHCPVVDTAHAGLSLAVLPTAALSVLARCVGVVLCAPRLRYAISGTQVRALQAALGPDVLRLAWSGESFHAGIPGQPFCNAEQASETVERLGYAVLHQAYRTAKPELARRFVLKLPRGPHDEPPVDSKTAMELATALADRGVHVVSD
jgi:type III secretion protein K